MAWHRAMHPADPLALINVTVALAQEVAARHAQLAAQPSPLERAVAAYVSRQQGQQGQGQQGPGPAPASGAQGEGRAGGPGGGGSGSGVGAAGAAPTRLHQLLADLDLADAVYK